MGFMDQFNQRPSLFEVIRQAEQIGGNNPLSAVQAMADSGVTCNLPNGRVISVKDMLESARGKTAKQLLSDLGL